MNALSGRLSVSQLCNFSWPTVVSLVAMSLYIMVDGAFVARLVGTDALSAVNIFLPAVSIYFACGIMLTTGASAIVARMLGEENGKAARENFTFIVIVAAVIGLVLGGCGLLFLDPILRVLGAEGEVYVLCRQYAAALLPFVPAAMIQTTLQNFYIAAGRPGLGMTVTLLGGLVNVVLDYVFIAVMDMGLAGAAVATGLGYSLPALIGLFFFARNRKGDIRFARPRADWRVLWESCVNGSSEMVTNLSAAVVTYLFNMSMMRYLGVNGVAAITIVLYAEFLLSSIYYGYASGVAPLFSYQYGRGDSGKVSRLFKNSLILISACSVAAVVLAQLLARYIVSVFAAPGGSVHDMAVHGYRLYSLCFLFMGYNIFASALFTALSNGKISALLSFARFIFIAAGILILPTITGVTGIWLAVPIAELLSFILSFFLVNRYRGLYRYV